MRQARHLTRALLVALLIPAMLFVQVPVAKADLTEVIVGATLAYQALQVVSTIIPQVALLTTNILSLFKTSQDLAGAVKDLFGNLAPHSNPAPKGHPAPIVASGPPLSLKDVPIIKGTTSVPPTPPATSDHAVVDASVTGLPTSIPARVDALVHAYTEQIALKDVIGRPGNLGPLSMQYSNSVSRAQQLTTLLSTQVLDALADGDHDTVDTLAAKVRSMPATDRAAVAPVLHAVLDGARFERLSGTDAQSAKIRVLRDLQAQIDR